jgi:hypothetical protein
MLSLVYAEEDPDPNPFTKWGIGVLVALAVAGYGIICAVHRFGYIPVSHRGHNAEVPIEGTNAIVFGVALLFAAAWLHFHFFWSQTPRMRPYYEVARIFASLGVLVTGLWVAVAVFRIVFDF